MIPLFVTNYNKPPQTEALINAILQVDVLIYHTFDRLHQLLLICPHISEPVWVRSLPRSVTEHLAAVDLAHVLVVVLEPPIRLLGETPLQCEQR